MSLGFRKATLAEVAGSFDLAVAAHDGQTRPTRTQHSGVLRLMQPLYLDDSGQVTYIIVNPGGALFGEKYEAKVEVEPGAHLLLTSQGATRIYKTPQQPAVQDISFTLGAGSRTEYVPDQTIAYRNADFRQTMTITAAPDAQGFFEETITPGWDPEAARFTYAGIRLRIDVRRAGSDRLALSDNLRIEPRFIGKAIEGMGYLEGFSHMGSILILGPHTAGDYGDEVRQIVNRYDAARVGVTTGTRHDVSWMMIRALANSTDELSDLARTINAFDRSVTTGQSRFDLRRY